MPVIINIRIKLVLLMVKFELPIDVRGKMQIEFDIQMPDMDYIRDAFQHFREICYNQKNLQKLHERKSTNFIMLVKCATVDCLDSYNSKLNYDRISFNEATQGTLCSITSRTTLS